MSEQRLPVRSEADLAALVGSIACRLDELGAPEEEKVRLLTAVSELARNILKYAGHGTVSFGCERLGTRLRCWMEARDEGPGIADVQRALADHFSTGNTLGLGLPGVRRLMDRMEIHSGPGVGTRVRAERGFST